MSTARRSVQGFEAEALTLLTPSPLTDVVPDIQTIGKGLNGGYQALSGVLMNEKVVAGLRSGSGAFANGMLLLRSLCTNTSDSYFRSPTGQTFQAHPAACSAGLAVMEVFKSDGIVANCAARGDEVSSRFSGRHGYLELTRPRLATPQLRAGLISALGDHPHVGEIRGRGLFLR